jgi:flagellar basal body-associated protein FliL
MSDALNSQTGFQAQLEHHEAPPELETPKQKKSKKLYLLIGLGMTLFLLVVGLLIVMRPAEPQPAEEVVPTPSVQPRSTGLKLELQQAESLLEAADPNQALQPPPAVDMKITF